MPDDHSNDDESSQAECSATPSPKALFEATRKRLKAHEDARRKELKAEKAKTKLRARQAVNSHAYRARASSRRQAALGLVPSAPPSAPEPYRPRADMQTLAIETAALATWLESRGRRQGAVRKIEKDRPGDIMKSRDLYLGLIEEIGIIPSWRQFAKLLDEETDRDWSREQARRRYGLIVALEGPDGPWDAR